MSKTSGGGQDGKQVVSPLHFGTAAQVTSCPDGWAKWTLGLKEMWGGHIIHIWRVQPGCAKVVLSFSKHDSAFPMGVRSPNPPWLPWRQAPPWEGGKRQIPKQGRAEPGSPHQLCHLLSRLACKTCLSEPFPIGKQRQETLRGHYHPIQLWQLTTYMKRIQPKLAAFF